MMGSILEIKDLTKKFGGLVAVDSFCLTVENQEIMGIIGPNGAGKTTLLNCVNGIYLADSGQILFQDLDITELPSHQIARAGIGRTFQIPRIFHKMTLVENLLAPISYVRGSIVKFQKRAHVLLRFVELEELKDNLGGEISGGQQKLLDLARVLMSDPKLLLLDEPFGGVHPELKRVFHKTILDLNRRGKTIVIISHELTSIYALCKTIAVMDGGRKIAQGSQKDIQENPDVIQAYLGG